MVRKCECSCGCTLDELDGVGFDEEKLCYPCDKGYRGEIGIKDDVCKICKKIAFGICNDDCGFLCQSHFHLHRHETNHIPIMMYRRIRSNKKVELGLSVTQQIFSNSMLFRSDEI